ncbi:cytochrome P450 [Basidiobolus meristosporus CBS 931.73]|uniref:Cytochrome P450 n=1 Tax=Basidiobolus meristosporus CBS 931.73 TaxID=1314790 RepID=A0A1Y1Y003_9FUNG|nr:cytochrome P450 [Basidiobolus meristosporus CBS 931.73]|eukprot:ORX91308.1 cytochrome P450 [Basidiobolus meristosporus CBS 931.73]
MLQLIIELGRLLLSAFVTYCIYFYLDYFLKRGSRPPGPIPLPFIGHIHLLIKCGMDFGVLANYIAEKYGEIAELSLFNSKPHIFICDEKLIREVYTTNKTEFVLRSDTCPESLRQVEMHERGIIMNNNLDTWKYNRRFLQHALMNVPFLRESIKQTAILCGEMCDIWESIPEDSNIDVLEWSKSLTMDIIALASTGKRMESLRAQLQKEFPSLVDKVYPKHSQPAKSGTLGVNDDADIGERYRHALCSYIEALGFFVYTPKFLWKYIPPFSTRAKAYKAMTAQLTQVENTIINEYRQEVEEYKRSQALNGKSTSKYRVNFLTAIMSAMPENENESSYNSDSVRQNLREMFSAGSDTTMGTFASLLDMITRHPEVERNLLAELESVFGDISDRSFIERITYEDMNKLKYTHAVLTETMRQFPSVPLNLRTARSGTMLAGYYVPERSQLTINIFPLHNKKSYFPDPEKFLPDRFTGNTDLSMENTETGLFKNVFPFGGGSRFCPGRYFAMLNLKLMLVITVSRMKLSRAEPEKVPVYRFDGQYRMDRLRLLAQRRF